MTSAKSKEIAEEYISSLSDLTINSKPLINMLTILAEENIDHAPAIVQAVENHLQKVRSDIKLPVLYLIDSIVKNVNRAYQSLFTQNIVNTFCGVFEKVDENTRASMWKLRQTWNGVFPAKKLFSLDVRVQSIDPAWPITSSPQGITSGSIHQQQSTQSTPTPPIVPPVTPVKLPPVDSVSMTEAAMREQLLKKQRELLELQKKKLELELLQTKASIEQQQRQLDKQAGNLKSELAVPTAHIAPTVEVSVTEKPVAPVVPNQASKQVTKQFPAATASLLKNAGTSNGPRIAPASSIAVASARPVSRDPRLKSAIGGTATVQEPTVQDPRLRQQNTVVGDKEVDIAAVAVTTTTTPSTAVTSTPSINTTVLSEQLKQQLITQKPSVNTTSTTVNTKSSTNDNANSITNVSNNNNNNNKSISGNAIKDAVSHRPPSQKQKDPHRSSSPSNNSNVISNSKLTNESQTLISSSNSNNQVSSRGGGGGRGEGAGGACTGGASGGNDSKSKDAKSSSTSSSGGRLSSSGEKLPSTATSSSTSSSSSSSSSKSSSSSSSSHRKVGNKSRSKQPQQSSSSKISKIERDCSPSSMPRSKSTRDNDNNSENSPPSSISSRTTTLPISSSSQSKNRKKSSSNKLRKRSPSPSYRIPRRNNESNKSSNSNLCSTGGVTEEEQSGSLIVSPPHPPTFKEIRPSARQRNYMRRNKEGSLSPEKSATSAAASTSTATTTASSSTVVEDTIVNSSATKDEDLRATLALPASTMTATVAEKKEDLDLRVLPPVTTGKRQSTENIESSAAKKTRAEKFDALFGNEDVDLRTLTHPKAGRPPTPPPPVISGEDGKDGWAKLKTPTKNERDKQANNEEKRERDRNRDRLGRPRLYSKLPDDPKERRRTLSNDDQDRPGRRRDNDKHDRNPDRNIEIIMKQAAEQLNQGSITKSQYNTLIQEVLHMSEDQKLLAAQRKEKETGTIVWEKGINIENLGLDRSGFNPGDNDLMRGNKDHHPRNQNGPRWNQPWQQPPGPWAHPPGPPFGQGHFNPDFRGPVGPWQNPRHFGPMRPDFPFHGGFNPNLGPNPRMNPGIMGPIGPNGPMMTNILQNGPISSMNPLANAQLMSGINGPPNSLLLNNGPLQPRDLGMVPNMPPPPLVNRNISPNNAAKLDHEEQQQQPQQQQQQQQQQQNYNNNPVLKTMPLHNRELPLADPKLLEEIANDPMKSINIDSVPRDIRYYGHTGIVFMNWDDPREIGFQDGSRRIIINDKDVINCAFNDDYKEFVFDGEVHRIKLGAPTRELYIDDRWYECYFGGGPLIIDLNGKKATIRLEGPTPQVKIGTVKRTDLVVGKINLIINARTMIPVFLDAKPQIFEIEGKPHTLEFTDALQTVLLNGRPFKVEFGGLPKPIVIRDTKHFIRFSVLPKGVRPGYVKIKGMKGEEPIEAPSTSPPVAQAPKVDADPAPAITAVPALEPDSTSQDDSDLTSASKPDLQLDVLSSALPSAMAPSSGLSYEAEPVENPPAPAPVLTLPLNMSELFQRLVETGIVPNLTEQKKQKEEEEEGGEEEKKEPEVIPVSFGKPETLKVKNPAIAAALYNGMQCSSCGARFAPELATRYSHHLDWHFRQNRRERDSARKAHSRPWYYDVSDWIQFEEIEDLEDRAQSWFETEKQTAETEGTTTEDHLPPEAVQPSVPTGTDEDSRCQVCHDAFEQFYNEEKEEWHLRPAINYEGKNFHPLCLEDHKRAMEKSAILDESTVEEEEKKEDTAMEESKDEPEEEIEKAEEEVNKSDEMKEPESVENNDESQKPAEEQPSAEAEKPEGEAMETGGDTEVTETEKKDEEEKVEAVEAGGEQEKPEESIPFENIKIKEEPVDVSEEVQEEEFVFSNVVIKEEPMDPEPEQEESVVTEPAAVDTTHAAVKSSIDGNVELESASATILSAPSKIKINITKPLASNKETEEPKDKQCPPPVETPTEEIVAPLVPASIKPTLQGRKLSNLPPVEKGHELSGLCSIM